MKFWVDPPYFIRAGIGIFYLSILVFSTGGISFFTAADIYEPFRCGCGIFFDFPSNFTWLEKYSDWFDHRDSVYLWSSLICGFGLLFGVRRRIPLLFIKATALATFFSFIFPVLHFIWLGLAKEFITRHLLVLTTMYGVTATIVCLIESRKKENRPETEQQLKEAAV